MSLTHDFVNPCTTLGHVYTSVTVIRCPHLEGWSTTVRCWSDTDSEDPDVHFEASRHFGPFDDEQYRTAVVNELLALAIWHQERAE